MILYDLLQNIHIEEIVIYDQNIQFFIFIIRSLRVKRSGLDFGQWSQLTRSVAIFFGSVFAFFVAAVFLTSRLGSLPVFNRLMLRPPSGTETIDGIVYSTEPSVEEPQANLAIGDVGVAESFLRPAGKAQFGDELYDVLTDGSFVDPGKSIKVVKVQGNNIVVREA